MKRAFGTLALLVALAPLSAHAASFKELTATIVGIVNKGVLPLLYTIAFMMFMIGIVRYFFMGGEENRQKGKQFAIWSIIGFVVLFTMWGLVRLLLTLLPGGGA